MEEYYVGQAGNGFPVYTGARFQRGSNFLGRFIKGEVWPLFKKVLPYLTDTLFSTGRDIYKDFMGGKDLKSTMKDRAEAAALKMGEDAIVKIRNRNQKGTGLKRSRPPAVPCIPKRRPKRRRKGIKGGKKRATKRRPSKRQRRQVQPSLIF